MPGIKQSTLRALAQMIFITTLRGRYYYNSHFRDEAQRGEVTCSSLLSRSPHLCLHKGFAPHQPVHKASPQTNSAPTLPLFSPPSLLPSQPFPLRHRPKEEEASPGSRRLVSSCCLKIDSGVISKAFSKSSDSMAGSG